MWRERIKSAGGHFSAVFRSGLRRFASLRITTKFGLSFSLLVTIVLMEMAIGYGALTAVWEANRTIQTSAEVQRLAMTMGRNWESMRRLQKEFFLYSRSNAEEAYRIHALANASKLTEVIRDGASLRRHLSILSTRQELSEQIPRVNLILSTASQYATMFDEATQLEIQLYATDSGYREQLSRQADTLVKQFAASENRSVMLSLLYEIRFFEEITRNDGAVNAAPNLQDLYDDLQAMIEGSSLADDAKTAAAAVLAEYQQAAGVFAQRNAQLTDMRLALDRMGESIEPELLELMVVVNRVMGQDRLQIAQTRAFAIAMLVAGAVTGIVIAIGVAVLLHFSVTRQVTRLTQVANQMRSGDLSVRARVDVTDEVGQLASTLNEMAAQLSATISRMDVVRQAGVELASELDVGKVSATALQTAIELSGADAGFLALVEDDTLLVTKCVGCYPPDFVDARIPIGDSVFAHLLAERQIAPIRTTDVPGLLASHVHLPIPLMARNETLGVLVLDSQRPDFPAPELLGFIELYSISASVSIQNALLYEDVQQMAIVDSLTGLYNRRGFLQVGIGETERVLRRRLNVSAIFLDIDYFKQFNDRYSYAVGDLVLRTIAKVLSVNVRESDLICRYGGEEFVILLPGMWQCDAIALAEHIRKQVELTSIQSGETTLTITISLGVSTWTPQAPGATAETAEQLLSDLVDSAGKMLHLAKSGGRNRVAASPASATTA